MIHLKILFAFSDKRRKGGWGESGVWLCAAGISLGKGKSILSEKVKL